MNIHASVNAAFDGYATISAEKLAEIAKKYDWISDPIHRASTYVRNMPYFEYIENMQSPHDFRDSGIQL